jgi:ABC-type molybdate transport system ATPase subunit
VSLTREAPGPSSILNILPARIVSMKAVDSNEIVVVVAFWGGRRRRACCRV